METVEAASASHPQRRSTQVLFVVAAAAFVAFWVWALFFASKEARNRVGDREWAARAERICEQADEQRQALIDLRPVDADDPSMLVERAGIIDRATDVLDSMVDDVVASAPRDEKGQAIVPLWEADYRTHLDDRRTYADVLRGGDNEPFRETAVDGIPISEKIATFATENEMPTCAPPSDL